MSDLNIPELVALAKAVSSDDFTGPTTALERFQQAASPAVVLALCERVGRAEELAERWERTAADLYAASEKERDPEAQRHSAS